jgi:hypothetical protein
MRTAIDHDVALPAYFGMIPANIRYDPRLSPSAKLLYAELTAWSNRLYKINVTNDQIADLYGVTDKMVETWVTQLELNGYIEVTPIKGFSGQIEEQSIKILK